MITRTERLEAAIQAARYALDPHKQGDCWPDPIAWDGRPLEEQAEDLLVLLDARIQGTAPGMDPGEDIVEAYARLGHALRGSVFAEEEGEERVV